MAENPDQIKEVCRLIRLARTYWDAHNNLACRTERTRALALYEALSPDQKELVPQVLRVWLRYRSEKYFGQAAPKNSSKPGQGKRAAPGNGPVKNRSGQTPLKGKVAQGQSASEPAKLSRRAQRWLDQQGEKA